MAKQESPSLVESISSVGQTATNAVEHMGRSTVGLVDNIGKAGLEAVDSMGKAGLEAVDNVSKGAVKVVSGLSKSGLNVVDQFLADMEPRNNLVRAATKTDEDWVPKNMRTQLAYQLFTNNYWRWFLNISIVLNAIQIGLDVEISGKTADDIWKVCDIIFTAIFAVEMIVAIVALRSQYFANPWNYLDFVVANIAIVDTCLLPFVMSGDTGGLSTFRVFRLLKLLRLAKMLKVIPELMMVVEGLVHSIKAMTWVFVLLMIVLYTAGIFCREIIGSSDAGYPAFSEKSMEENIVMPFNNYLYFGSIARSMSTLFNLVVLAEWENVLRPVAEHQPAMVFFFICVVFLCSFGVLNVMVGIVVENTTNAMQEARDEEYLRLQKSQIKLASSLADLVFTLDQDSDQKISQEELENPDNAEELHSIIGSLGLPHGYSLEELFVMLDVDGNGSLSKLEFVQGIMRLIYCDQFQRDCLFRTSIGQVKQAVAKSEERLRQSFKNQLQEACTHLISVVKGESSGPFSLDDFTIDLSAPVKDHADFPLKEHSDIQMVYARVVDAEELNLSGPWNELISAEVLCVEAVEVSVLGALSGASSSLAGSDSNKATDLEKANRDTSRDTSVAAGALSDPSNRKKVTWDALRKSLLGVYKTEGCAFDAQTAEKMIYTLSRSHEVMGWMPVVKRRLVKV